MSNLMQILYSLALCEAYCDSNKEGKYRYRLRTLSETHRIEFICPSNEFDSVDCKDLSCVNCPLLFGGMYDAENAISASKLARNSDKLLRLIVVGIEDELSNRIETFNQMEH